MNLPNILHIITRIGRGGAQMMLYRLLRCFRESGDHELRVISLMDENRLSAELADLGVSVHTLGMRRGMVPFRALRQLRSIIRAIRPDLIHGWMYHSNIVASLVAGNSVPVIWGVHTSVNDIKREKKLTRLLIRAGPILSYRVSRIIYCSHISAMQHERIGYPSGKRAVIPNGFDVDLFRPDREARLLVRQGLGLPTDAIVIGHAARYHPMKNHAGLLRAFAELLDRHPRVRLVMAGREVRWDNPTLASLARALKLDGKVWLLGEQRDMARLMNAFDIYSSSSSWGEAFPIVLGEAMACEVPCVTTDVGDSAAIVAETGVVVPAGDEAALVEALDQLIQAGREVRKKLGMAARERVVNKYSLPTVAAAYRDLYEEVVGTPPHGRVAAGWHGVPKLARKQ